MSVSSCRALSPRLCGDASDVLPDSQVARWLDGSDMFRESVGGVNRNLEFRIER